MSKHLRKQDPQLEREKARYAEPLPSREFILETLRDAGVPTSPAALAEILGIESREMEPFQRRLGAMERDGQLLKNRKGALCVAAKLDMLAGRVQGHPDGHGFFIPDDGSPDMFLAPREMHKALHGDRVSCRQIGLDRRGRPEGTIVDVLERSHRKVVGRIHVDRGIWFLVAEDKRINQDLLIPPDGRGDAEPGEVVVAEIIEQPTAHIQALAHVLEVLGHYTDPGMEIEIALRKHDLPFEFSVAAAKLAGKLPKSVRLRDKSKRIDLTSLPLVTIDGETARDFDDAVFAEKKGKGFRLVVAIADVSHYVTEGDALDQDARERGNSVYFPRRVIPMLPEALSNGLCSLNPGVDRLCVACDIDISATGQIKAYRFYSALMHSRARLTYTQVAKWLDEPRQIDPAHAALLSHLTTLRALFQVLLTAREKRGAIDFESSETLLDFDDQGKIASIRLAERNEAHRVIEECMLAANVCAAHLLLEHEQPALYRVHEGPSPEKLTGLRDFLGGVGLALGGGDDPGAKDYASLLARIRSRPDFALLQTVLLRSLKQAVYSPGNLGHFGLAYDAYTHFTSPIRRYPDLVVHRAIKAVAEGGPAPKGDLAALGQHCSMTERRADDATRDVENWLKCFYMQDHLGSSFMGTISNVTHFGIFVTLDEIFIDGLVHITELGSDYFQFSAPHHTLTGERGGRVFRLADRLRVKVARVDLETSRIDFVLDDPRQAPASPKTRPRR